MKAKIKKELFIGVAVDIVAVVRLYFTITMENLCLKQNQSKKFLMTLKFVQNAKSANYYQKQVQKDLATLLAMAN